MQMKHFKFNFTTEKFMVSFNATSQFRASSSDGGEVTIGTLTDCSSSDMVVGLAKVARISMVQALEMILNSQSVFRPYFHWPYKRGSAQQPNPIRLVAMDP